jgi:hypothetical protein
MKKLAFLTIFGFRASRPFIGLLILLFIAVPVILWSYFSIKDPDGQFVRSTEEGSPRTIITFNGDGSGNVFDGEYIYGFKWEKMLLEDILAEINLSKAERVKFIARLLRDDLRNLEDAMANRSAERERQLRAQIAESEEMLHDFGYMSSKEYLFRGSPTKDGRKFIAMTEVDRPGSRVYFLWCDENLLDVENGVVWLKN